MKLNPRKYIAVDLGAESGRVAIANLKEETLELNEVHRFPTRTVNINNTLRWDLPSILTDIINGLTKARKMFGAKFEGIAVDTWGVDYVLIGRDGRPLGYPFHYRDGRTDDLMEEAFGIVTSAEMYKKNGLQFAQFNTVFQLLADKRDMPGSLECADNFLLMPDFLNFYLCGERFSEYTIASTTGLTNPANRDWEWSLVEAFDLPKRLFPQIVEPGRKLGGLIDPVAKQTGLNRNIPIFATACHDTGSAVVSVPAAKSGDWAFLSSGTWSLMGIEVSEPIRTALAMEHNFTNEGGVEGVTRFLKNIMGLWPLQECKREWGKKSKGIGYAELTELALQKGPVGSWINLNDPSFLKPGNMPARIIEFLDETGQRVESEFGFIVRVILESLAFGCKTTKREIEEVTGRKIEVVHAVGGGTQNTLLMQLTADALGCSVVAGPVEGTVVGNVGVQAIASGYVHDVDHWRHIVASSFPLVTYEPKGTFYFDKNEPFFSLLRSTRK